MRYLRRWLAPAVLTACFLAPAALAQSVPGLSVHATADSLYVRMGSETVVVPRDALALLSSPDGYNQAALSLHLALLHGSLTIEDGSGDEGDPSGPTLPLLTASAPLGLGIDAAAPSPGNKGHSWEATTLEGQAVLQHLPDSGTRYNTSTGPRLTWEVEVADAGAYYLYVQGAGISKGNTHWAGTSERVEQVALRTNRGLEWVRVGPFSLEAGPAQLEVRGREDGAYVGAVVVSASPDLSDGVLGDVAASAGSTYAGRDAGTAQRSSAGDTSVPEVFSFHPLYPNPTRGAATARFDLPDDAEVSLEVFDALGRRVAGEQASFSAGFGQTLPVDTGSLSSGVYIVRVSARTSSGDTIGAQRLTVVR